VALRDVPMLAKFAEDPANLYREHVVRRIREFCKIVAGVFFVKLEFHPKHGLHLHFIVPDISILEPLVPFRDALARPRLVDNLFGLLAYLAKPADARVNRTKPQGPRWAEADKLNAKSLYDQARAALWKRRGKRAKLPSLSWFHGISNDTQTSLFCPKVQPEETSQSCCSGHSFDDPEVRNAVLGGDLMDSRDKKAPKWGPSFDQRLEYISWIVEHRSRTLKVFFEAVDELRRAKPGMRLRSSEVTSKVHAKGENIAWNHNFGAVFVRFYLRKHPEARTVLQPRRSWCDLMTTKTWAHFEAAVARGRANPEN
jgi:hypothetical protein